jgi:hypothetical protein
MYPIFYLVTGGIVGVVYGPKLAGWFDGWLGRRPASAPPLPLRPVAPPPPLPGPVERRAPVAPEPRQAAPGSVNGTRLAQDLASLFDDLDLQLESMEHVQRSKVRMVLGRLAETLERAGVGRIDGDSTFDLLRHQPDANGELGNPGDRIARTLSPGFVLDGRVIRRARVELATREG